MLLGDIIKYFLPFHTIQRLSEFQLTFMTYPFHCISYLLFSLLNVLHFFLVKCKSGIKHNSQKYSSIFVHFFTLYDSGYLFYRFHKIICSIQLSLLTIAIQASDKRTFTGSGTFQILSSVSNHQIRSRIVPDNFLHDLRLRAETIRFTVIKLFKPSFHSEFFPMCFAVCHFTVA